MEISFDMRVIQGEDVMIRTVGDESVILDLKTERYLGLDAVGTQMWTSIVSSPSIHSAYKRLLDEYDVDPDRLEYELRQFLEKLRANGLITVLPAPPPADSPHPG